MSFVNKVILLGNCGGDPEVKIFDNGSKIATVSLATSKFYRSENGEKQTIVEWHRIVIKNKHIIQHIIEKGYIKKGSKIYLEGELSTKEFKDANGLNANRITEVVINNSHYISILSNKDNISSEDYGNF